MVGIQILKNKTRSNILPLLPENILCSFGLLRGRENPSEALMWNTMVAHIVAMQEERCHSSGIATFERGRSHPLALESWIPLCFSLRDREINAGYQGYVHTEEADW